jgi:hypothetical protein
MRLAQHRTRINGGVLSVSRCHGAPLKSGGIYAALARAPRDGKGRGKAVLALAYGKATAHERVSIAPLPINPGLRWYPE